MKSPKDMRIIEIDITNACVNKCSNCTRFCGHHKKPFFMDFETFKKAVDSLDEFTGMVGIIGGEPTIHPEFEKFAEYIGKKRLGKSLKTARKPIMEMLPYAQQHLMKVEGSKCGLFSTLGRSYYKHFEVINDSFSSQFLNDHNNTCMHQALLMSRKDCGLTDEEWIPQRDACWIQNLWSATITPKGAFFCEVAGALDMLFNGPGGWEVTKDWWKREPKDFGDQLKWCELCSCGFDVPRRLSNDGRDDVSPTIYQKLLEVESPKARMGKCVIHTKEEYQANKHNYKAFKGEIDYMEENNSQRLSCASNLILPREFVFCKNNELKKTLEEKPKDWIIVSDNEENAKIQAETQFKYIILNPGCLYLSDNMLIFNVTSHSLRDKLDSIDGIKSVLKSYPKDKIINLDDEHTSIKPKLEKVLKLMKLYMKM